MRPFKVKRISVNVEWWRKGYDSMQIEIDVSKRVITAAQAEEVARAVERAVAQAIEGLD